MIFLQFSLIGELEPIPLCLLSQAHCLMNRFQEVSLVTLALHVLS